MIDSHCHLNFDKFEGQHDEILSEANDAGVHTIINVGAELPSSKFAVRLADRYDCMYATVGVHPHDATTVNDEVLVRLKELSAHDKVVAIGEIGLDYYRDLSPRPVQHQAFRKQLELACVTKLPVVIHTRDSFTDTVEIIREYSDDLAGGVFHCFPGTTEDAYEVFALGFHISVGGVITFKDSGMARTAAEVPLEKILLETDAPYLTPVPFRGKPNRPAYISFVRDKLAELQGISPTEVERVTDQTCRKLFRLVETFGG